MADKLLEVWMRGPVENVPSTLQPVAHALLQASEEVQQIMKGFSDERLWDRPAGLASVGFHLKHLKGVLERLFIYSRSEMLNETQLAYLNHEGEPSPVTAGELVIAFQTQVDISIAHLMHVREDELFAPRGIGRKQIPTNVIGLLFHAAEHTQRHVGQLLVTTRIVMTGGW